MWVLTHCSTDYILQFFYRLTFFKFVIFSIILIKKFCYKLLFIVNISFFNLLINIVHFLSHLSKIYIVVCISDCLNKYSLHIFAVHFYKVLFNLCSLQQYMQTGLFVQFLSYYTYLDVLELLVLFSPHLYSLIILLWGSLLSRLLQKKFLSFCIFPIHF